MDDWEQEVLEHIVEIYGITHGQAIWHRNMVNTDYWDCYANRMDARDTALIIGELRKLRKKNPEPRDILPFKGRTSGTGLNSQNIDKR